nr:helix-turn-helix transcriptional regulator [Bacilli bacterium]
MENKVPREARAHGDASFPLCVYHVVLTPGPTQQIVNYHWHEETEFVLVTRGAVNIQVGTDSYIVHRGQGILINREEVHAFTEADSEESECYAVVFDLALLLSSSSYDRLQHQYLRPIIQEDWFFPTYIKGETTVDIAILSHLQEIVRVFPDCAAFEMTIKGHMLLIMAVLLESNQMVFYKIVDTVKSSNMARMKLALDYIGKHYQEKIRLKDLAEQLAVSEGHMSRLFKQMTQKTIIEFINDLRVNEAAKLLQSTDKSVVEISNEVGFEDPSYFNRVFRMIKKCSPSQFRRLFEPKKMSS